MLYKRPLHLNLQMSRAAWIALLALLLVSEFAHVARANDDDDSSADEPTDQEAAEGEINEKQSSEEAPSISGIQARAYFLTHDGDDLKIHAGERVEALIGFSNAASNPTLKVIFATAHLMYAGSAAAPQNDGANYVMNFSGTMYERDVKPGDTATFHYAFLTDEQIDPRSYDIAIKIYFSTENNASYVANAFQSTVLIEDPLSFDYKTYGTLVAIVAAAGYAGFHYTSKRKRGRVAVARNLVELSSGVKYDPAYVSNEHLKFVEATKKSKSGSPKRAPSK